MSRFEEYLEASKVSKDEQVKHLMSYINIELDHELSLDRNVVEKLKTNIEKILREQL